MPGKLNLIYLRWSSQLGTNTALVDPISILPVAELMAVPVQVVLDMSTLVFFVRNKWEIKFLWKFKYTLVLHWLYLIILVIFTLCWSESVTKKRKHWPKSDGKQKMAKIDSYLFLCTQKLIEIRRKHASQMDFVVEVISTVARLRNSWLVSMEHLMFNYHFAISGSKDMSVSCSHLK